MPRLRITPAGAFLSAGQGPCPFRGAAAIGRNSERIESLRAQARMPHHRQKLHDGRTERVADSEQNQWVDYPCGDNPVAKAYLQTMKDLLTQMERMSSTQQFADSLAEPLNLAK